ncbi:DNA excision repair protein ERCC-6-like [Arapaima gigas]
MPLTMKMDWVDKLTEWTPGINWQFYHYTEENPTRNLRSVQTGGDVLLTSYRMLVHHQRAFSFCKNKPFVWDCVIYDEAPELKSHTTKTFQVASEIQAKFTIILNGAPVLSNLQNMWSLFSIITPPRLLGNYNDFKKLYKDPITRATEADASPMERAWGNEMLWRLQKMIEPYFLSRTKDKIFNSAHGQRVVQLNSKDIPHLPKKTELVVWIRLSPEQETMYQELISSRGPSAQAHYSMQDVHTLKSICNHPRQLQENYQRLPIDILFAESEKLEFLVLLLNRLLEEGHRILVFCQSLKMLDIIQYVLEEKKLGPLLRIDGATRLQERERQCELFHGDASYRILLFSTRVGAVGLTLTSASRIVIVDPSWNQAVDSQAVNQAYSMSESSLLFEDEISDQQGSSSKLSGQSKECSIVHGLAAASQGVPAADVIQTKSSSEQRTQGGKPGLAQNHFNSPYDADKWREPISIPLFSDSNDESFDQSETEESEAEDSSDTSLEMVSPSINTPSEPQINNRETPSLSSMQSTISFENMMPPNKRNKIRWEAQKRSTKITFSSGAGFEKTEKDQLPSHHRLVLRELQPKVLKQKCSSASSALMVHPLKVHAPLDTDCKENYCHSNVSARFGQGPSKNSKLDVTCFPKTSTRVADGKMVRSQQPDEVQPGKCTESSISSSHSRLTVGQLIEVLQNVLQMLKN